MLKSGAFTFGLASFSAEAPSFGTPNSGDLTPVSKLLPDASISGVCMPRFDVGVSNPPFVLPRDGSEMFGLSYENAGPSTSIAPPLLAFGTSNSGDFNPDFDVFADTSTFGVSITKSGPAALPSMSIVGSSMPDFLISADPSKF